MIARFGGNDPCLQGDLETCRAKMSARDEFGITTAGDVHHTKTSLTEFYLLPYRITIGDLPMSSGCNLLKRIRRDTGCTCTTGARGPGCKHTLYFWAGDLPICLFQVNIPFPPLPFPLTQTDSSFVPVMIYSGIR